MPSAASNETASLSPHLGTLGDIFGEAGRMLEAASQLMTQQSPARLPGDGELRDVCESLQTACDEVRPLIGAGGHCCHGDAEAAPRLLVLGQPKCGKSSFINAMLGQTVVRQSESPWGTPAELTRLRHSPKSHTRRYCDGNGDVIESQQQSDCSASSETSSPKGEPNSLHIGETPTPVVEFGLPIELLRRAGVEIVDSPGSQDSPPVDAWGLAASPAVVVYVIDAVSGVTREVEEDLRQLQHRFASSQLIFVLNKMDATATVAAAAGVTAAEAAAAMRHRALARLRGLGCLATEEGDGGGRFFCLSCRRLRTLRRGRGGGGGGDDEAGWLESLDRLRSDILGGVARRLGRLVTEAAGRLEAAARTFEDLAGRADNLKECKEQAWENILGLEKRVMRDTNESLSNALIDRMLVLLSERKPDILEAARAMELPPTEQAAAEAEIERLVLDLQLKYCQECADAELTTRLQRMDDVIAALASYQEPLPPAPVPDVDRQFSMKDGLDVGKLERSPSKHSMGKDLVRSIGRSKATWKMDVAKKFMRSLDLKTALKQSVDRLEAQIHRAHVGTQKSVGRANARINELRDALKARSRGLREQRRACLKLWLRLQSVLAEVQCPAGLQWQSRACIAVGVQGSSVYRVNCHHQAVASGSGRRAMAVKKFALDDEQLGAMAAALHYNCTSTNDFVLRIERLQLRKLSDQPTLWQLHLWTELMQQCSLQQQLPRLCQQTPLSDRLGIGLSIAEALARMHSDRQSHANLRMSNIFICQDGKSVKLSDIGQARTVPLRLNALCRDAIELFPPELMQRRPSADSAAVDASAGVDAFSLGGILRSLGLEFQVKEVADEMNKLVEDCSRQCPGERPPVSDVAERLRQIASRSLEQSPPTGD